MEQPMFRQKPLFSPGLEHLNWDRVLFSDYNYLILFIPYWFFFVFFLRYYVFIFIYMFLYLIVVVLDFFLMSSDFEHLFLFPCIHIYSLNNLDYCSLINFGYLFAYYWVLRVVYISKINIFCQKCDFKEFSSSLCLVFTPLKTISFTDQVFSILLYLSVFLPWIIFWCHTKGLFA